MDNMNLLTTAERVRIVACLVEGSGVRSTCRMTGFAKGTVLKLLCDLGAVCETIHDEKVRGLRTARLECDEIWSYVGMKKKNVPESMKDRSDLGDIWTWTGLDADSKLMVSWLVGDRTNESARAMMWDMAGRIVSERVQLTSDGYRYYRHAIDEAFGDSADYSELHKVYGGADGSANARYSPSICIGCIRRRILGNPNPEHISTSYVERANLTMRMGMRRFTRLTNAFSKKLTNHVAAIALFMVHYNFCKVHGTIKKTPAMAAGITDHVWSIDEIVAALEERERAIIGTAANKRGPYKKTA